MPCPQRFFPEVALEQPFLSSIFESGHLSCKLCEGSVIVTKFAYAFPFQGGIRFRMLMGKTCKSAQGHSLTSAMVFCPLYG